MEKINLTFLGTSDSVPSKTRNHTSILLGYKNEAILIDCGEGSQRQFRFAELNPCSITKILITHWHGDHVLGIPALLQTLAMSNYNKTLQIYGPVGTKKYMGDIMGMFIFRGKLKYKVEEVRNKFIYETAEFFIETRSMQHGKPANAYSFVIKDKRRLDKKKLKKFRLPSSPLLKKLQQGSDVKYNNIKITSKQVSYVEKGKKVAFILDTAKNSNAVKLSRNADVLICESTYIEKDREKANRFKHLTAKQAGEIAKKANVKKLILTHVSQRYPNPRVVLSESKRIFKNVILAEDLLKVSI